ncbi:hypothetical protein [Roseicella aquatilis]|uniref:Uncharacterized protein n=1 Tax=Roseicella aquatilis TaxID=2527868 RepID=A0A4V2WM47_9PROT|nr:hypothetical protein [Roseicella aquatilis]TCZ66202.1 hypothetical protein EXY23_02590 [Roseicella aquatilis]
MGNILSWLTGGRTIEVPCTVDIEQTFDSLHAHAIPEGVTLRPGDRVVVHGVPAGVPYGETLRFTGRATIHRAGWLARAWTEASAILELTELYHCGFEPKEAS